MPTLSMEGLSKTYGGQTPVEALKDVHLTIEQGEYVAIEGPSGAGKSTLLNLLALLDAPSEGDYLIDGESTIGLDDAKRARRRSSTFAFIFQSFHLLEGRSVVDNVALGGLYRDLPATRRRELAEESLAFVGLSHKSAQKVEKLSGGERQRVAIARAIASHAPIVVADEPTGNLDSANGALVMDTLERLNAQGATVIIVTHDQALASRAPRRLHVYDGSVTDTTIDAPTRQLVLAGGQEMPSDDTVAIPTWDTIMSHTSDSEGDSESTHVLPESTGVGAAHYAPMEGKDSRVRFRDALADTWKGLWTKPSRTIALIMAVALGVGLALTTAGLSTTASYQVSDIFDAQRNQRVALSVNIEKDTPAASSVVSPEAFTRMANLAGVVDLAVFASHGSAPVTTRASTQGQGENTEIYGLVEGHIPSTFTVDSGGISLDTLGDDEILVGSQLAGQLELGPLLASPNLWVNGQPKRVAGILTQSGLQVSLLNGILITETSAATLGTPSFAGAEIRVQPGAGAQVAAQAPVAWNPTDPDSVQVEAPPDPASMRDTIESNLKTMLFTLTGVSLLAAILMLTNSMTTAVFQRTGEFGLRRAIGARRIHITSLTLTESLVIGTIGGLIGTYISIIGILAITIARQWQPVFDPQTIPIGIGGGILVGLLGGLIATARASKIQPSDALRA